LHTLCKLEDVDPKTGKDLLVSALDGNCYIALFRLADNDQNESVRAYLNACPHQGRSLNFAPGRFLFAGEDILMCPHHGACFKVSTGECISGPCKGAQLSVVEVCVKDGLVQLEEDL